jgi:hypothetical protein
MSVLLVHEVPFLGSGLVSVSCTGRVAGHFSKDEAISLDHELAHGKGLLFSVLEALMRGKGRRLLGD